MHFLRPTIVTLLALLALAAVVAALQTSFEASANPGGKMYWTDSGTGKVQRALLAEAGPDILAFTAFPIAHWRQI